MNTKELQKFHDMLAPVVSALPAIINAAERAEELERHVAVLEERRLVALTGQEEDLAKATVRLNLAKLELIDIAAAKATLSAEVKTHADECSRRKAEAEAAVVEQIKSIKAEADRAEQEARKRFDDAQAFRKDQSTQLGEQLAQKLSDLNDLEKRYRAVEKSFETLRNKLS